MYNVMLYYLNLSPVILQCQNPSCQGEKEFDHTLQERRLLGEFGVDPEQAVYCRQCRELRRLAWRNERVLFKRKCDQSGKDIWSTYDQNSPLKIYDKDVWWGDGWEGTGFGRDFDFSRPFFEQFHELMLGVPRPAVIQMKNQNSEFCNDANNNNDCYMIFTSDDNVNCHYGSFINCKDCIDCEEIYQCELCSDSLYCHTCNGMVACEYCMNCSNTYFSSNCINCHNCVFCFGLRDRRNCIFNTEVSPDVFQSFIMQRQLFRQTQYQKSREMFQMFLETVPQRFMFLLKTENSTGDRLISCKECENCYSAENCVNCSNCASSALDLRDCMDCWAAAYGIQKSFELQTCLRGGFNFIGNFSNDCNGCLYIDNCQSCQECFGCSGLKRKRYCILNKQLTKNEYDELLPKVIEHLKKNEEWGQFFPLWCSPYAYNTTIAQLWYPMDTEHYMAMLTHSETAWEPGGRYKRDHLWNMKLAEGWPPRDQAKTTPESLFDKNNEELLSTVFYDPETNEPFRLTGRELALYQQMKLPLPKHAFTTRYRKRFKRFNARQLYKRQCQRCKTQLQTSFSPKSDYIVFCADCFTQSIN